MMQLVPPGDCRRFVELVWGAKTFHAVPAAVVSYLCSPVYWSCHRDSRLYCTGYSNYYLQLL